MSIKDSASIALFAAIIAVLGLLPKIDLPIIPVPITAQLLGVLLAGSILGAVRGALAVTMFLLLVAAGLPLLAGGRGGLGVFAGPSAGFLFAFPIAAFVVGALTERYWSGLTFLKLFLINVIGVVLIYAVGIPGIAVIAGTALKEAALGSLLFVPGDILKSVLAAGTAMFVKRGYPMIHPT